MIDTNETKRCCRCGELKLLERFTPDKRASDGKGSACKDCINISARKSHETNRVTRNKRARYLGRKNRAKVTEYKLEKGCLICGFNRHGSALDFHHIDSTKKEANIGNLSRGAWKKVEEELKKCVVICSNCHRMLHAGYWGDLNSINLKTFEIKKGSKH